MRRSERHSQHETAVGARHAGWAQSLESGRWFTLDHNGARVQVQYVWHSRRKHLHLFASLDGHCYLLQAQRMATYLQAGLLAVHDAEALTVRATRDALQKIRRIRKDWSKHLRCFASTTFSRCCARGAKPSARSSPAWRGLVGICRFGAFQLCE
jgi:hypothetical protein